MHVLRRRDRVALLLSATVSLGAAAALSACASGGGPFPSSGDPTAPIANASRLIGEAQQAGADSVAPEAMAAARQALADAQVLVRRRSSDRAAVRGREAAAEAAYAKAAAQRAVAEREHGRAKAALDSLSGGSQ